MIGTRPPQVSVPHEYRYALDAAVTLLPPTADLLVRCAAPVLGAEIRQRFPCGATPGAAVGALWVEPCRDTWRAELATLARVLPAGAPLVVIGSAPLATWLPERSGRDWPAGLGWCGLIRLRRALHRSGFVLEARYGIHSALSIGLNVLGSQAARRGRPEVGDRLHFAARLRYQVTGPGAWFATIDLLRLRKVR